MNILIINNQNKFSVQKNFLILKTRSLIEFFIKNLGIKKFKGFYLTSIEDLELTLVFVSSREIKRLNSTFRKKNQMTDILSFESLGSPSLGELILCPEIINKKAFQMGWPQRCEYLYMISHGILHLLGFDHQTVSEEVRMLNLQDRAFNSLDLSYRVLF